MGEVKKFGKEVSVFTDRDVRTMDYALSYVKKVGIAKFEKELQRIKRAFGTAKQQSRDTVQNGCTNQKEFENAELAQSPMYQTEVVVDMSSATPTQLMCDSFPTGKQENVLIYAQKNAGLRSLLEIADEIDLLLTLTEEMDSDSLALRKLKRALTRKQLIQVGEEVAKLHKVAIAEMGNEAWRWA